jgi:hypothetical protein
MHFHVSFSQGPNVLQASPEMQVCARRRCTIISADPARGRHNVPATAIALGLGNQIRRYGGGGRLNGAFFQGLALDTFIEKYFVRKSHKIKRETCGSPGECDFSRNPLTCN